MSDVVDLRPSVATLAAIVRGITDEQLVGPTPCPDTSVADLLAHVDGLSVAFTAAARKERPPGGGRAPADGVSLGEGWRERIGAHLAGLGEAWLDPVAHEGVTVAGGLEMPAGQVALVALDEVTVHGWDLAVATGQPYDADPTAVEACAAWVESFEAPRDGSLFGPRVPVPDDAPAMDRLLGATGRDPGWTPAG